MPVFPWSMSDFKPGEENNRERARHFGLRRSYARMLFCSGLTYVSPVFKRWFTKHPERCNEKARPPLIIQGGDFRGSQGKNKDKIKGL